MALRPTGPQDAAVPTIRGRPPRPNPARTARPAPEPVERSTPRPGFRLRTAMTEADIDAQIDRLMKLIANDNIDPNAPSGSYLNFMI
jgi:hypothetical protein